MLPSVLHIDGIHRRLHGILRRQCGMRAERHQACAGLHHHLADRLHDRWLARGMYLGRSARRGLGYMASMFHLFTHAMFKALLFLGAGSIIHAVHCNEMSAMGGLRNYMPMTHATFLIACLAIAESGLLAASSPRTRSSPHAFALQPRHGMDYDVIAAMTAFYMFRLYSVSSGRREKSGKLHGGDSTRLRHESLMAMTLPLMLLLPWLR